MEEIKIYWRRRLNFAIRVGYSPEAEEEIIKEACIWKTCAVGSLEQPIERHIYYLKDQPGELIDTHRTTYAPKDHELQDLGISFSMAVEGKNWAKGLYLLDKIERRAIILCNHEKTGNNTENKG